MTNHATRNAILDDARKKMFGVAFITLALSASLPWIYWAWFSHMNGAIISRNSADWGTFGDFVGGIANPIVSLATLLIVALAYISQRQELADTSEALTQSAQEQKKLSEVTRLQAQIQAEAAILSRLTSLRSNVFAEMQRIAGSNLAATTITMDGDLVSGAEGKSAKVIELRKSLEEIEIGIEGLQGNLKLLVDLLSTAGHGSTQEK